MLTKLAYGLASAWLNTAQRRRVDGFQARCLRRIWGVPPSYISRISNKTVLDRASQRPLTRLLEKEQLLLYGRAARAAEDSIMRSSTFCPGSLRPACDRYVRRVGRPRLEWTSQVQRLALAAAGSWDQLSTKVQNKEAWTTCVGEYYSGM